MTQPEDRSSYPRSLTLRKRLSGGRDVDSRSLRLAIRELVDPRSLAREPVWHRRVRRALALLPATGPHPLTFVLLDLDHHSLHEVNHPPGEWCLPATFTIESLIEFLQTQDDRESRSLHLVNPAGSAPSATENSQLLEWVWPVRSGRELLGFWLGSAKSGGDPDLIGKLEEFNYWLLLSWEARSTELHDAPAAASDAPLTRWLVADSLRALCARAYQDFRASHGISSLMILSRADGRYQSWAVFPPDDELMREVETWVSTAGEHGGTGETAEHSPIATDSAVLIAPDPKLRAAGLRYGAIVDTGRATSYSVYWGDLGDSENAECARPESVTKGPLWRPLEFALTNMARLEYLRELSHIDSITKVFNRRHFNTRLVQEVARARRFDRPLALTIFDLDHFKTINDTYGHQLGDTILRDAADFVRDSIRSIDVFCRLGGDEFAIMMPDAGTEDCERFCGRLCHALANHQFTLAADPPMLQLTISIGAAVYPEHADHHERLLWCADMALLHAKQAGRSRAQIYNESLQPVENALSLR